MRVRNICLDCGDFYVNDKCANCILNYAANNKLFVLKWNKAHEGVDLLWLRIGIICITDTCPRLRSIVLVPSRTEKNLHMLVADSKGTR